MIVCEGISCFLRETFSAFRSGVAMPSPGAQLADMGMVSALVPHPSTTPGKPTASPTYGRVLSLNHLRLDHDWQRFPVSPSEESERTMSAAFPKPRLSRPSGPRLPGRDFDHRADGGTYRRWTRSFYQQVLMTQFRSGSLRRQAIPTYARHLAPRRAPSPMRQVLSLRPGRHLLLPGQKGLGGVLFGLEGEGETADRFLPGRLTQHLPDGVYRFANEPHDARLASLAFALGSTASAAIARPRRATSVSICRSTSIATISIASSKA